MKYGKCKKPGEKLWRKKNSAERNLIIAENKRRRYLFDELAKSESAKPYLHLLESRFFQHYYIKTDNLEILAMLISQGGECAVCRSNISQLNEVKAKCNVDRCHFTGKIRGLLCTACNIAIPNYATPSYFRMLAEYFKNANFPGEMILRKQPHMLLKFADYLEYHATFHGYKFWDESV